MLSTHLTSSHRLQEQFSQLYAEPQFVALRAATSGLALMFVSVQEHPEKITCPSCHSDCQLGPAGVAGLLPDYGVSGVHDAQLDGAYCTGCKSRESSAVARCFDCSNFLCANCVMAHQVWLRTSCLILNNYFNLRKNCKQPPLSPPHSANCYDLTLFFAVHALL